jgi:hypothetical protein
MQVAFGGELKKYYEMILERIDELEPVTDPETWDGVYRATSK